MSTYCIGAAQFGVSSYGFNETALMPSEEIYDILDYSLDRGINCIDTSPFYGNCEKTLSSYPKKNDLQIFSKVKGEFTLDHILQTLNLKRIEGCFIHSFKEFYFNKHIYETLRLSKKKGKINQIGFSLYYPQELKYLLDNRIEVDMVQVPYNFFDRRFESFFSTLKALNIKIFCRSIFLQGLIFSPPSDREIFKLLSPKVALLKKYCQELKVSREYLCIKFCAQNDFLNYVIVGTDDLAHHKSNTEALLSTGNISFKEDFLSQMKTSNFNKLMSAIAPNAPKPDEWESDE